MRKNSKSAIFTRAFKQDPLFMAKFFWGDKGDMFYLPFAEFHKDAIKTAMNTKKNDLAIIVPRGFGKTKIFGVLYALHQIVTNKEPYVMIISNSEAKAKQSLRDIQTLIRYSKFRKVYGNLEAESDIWDTSRKRLINKSLGIDCLLEAKGAGQQILGASEGKARPTLMIFDDLMSSEQALNPDRIETLLDWYNTVALPALTLKDFRGKAGRTLNIGTPFQPDDYISNVMKWRTTKVIKYTAMTEEDRSIWEDMVTTEELRRIRDSYIERGAKSSWETQYMLNPQAKQGLSFPPDKIVYISAKESQKRLKSSTGVYIMVDMAYTQETYSDAIGITVTAHNEGGILTCLEAIRGKFNQDELFDILYDLKVKYSSKLEGIFVETKQYQLIRQFFFEKGVRVSKPVDIYPLIWKGEAGERGKLNRISMLIPYAHLGNIELVEGYTKPLEIEMLSFDGRKKKGLDTLDSFSYNALYLTESNICVTNKSIMNSVENMTVDEHFKKYVTDRTDEFEDYGDMFL